MSSAKLRAVIWGRGKQPEWLTTIGGKPRIPTEGEIYNAEIPNQDHWEWAATVEMYEGDLERYSEHDPSVQAWSELECITPASNDDEDEE